MTVLNQTGFPPESYVAAEVRILMTQRYHEKIQIRKYKYAL